MKKFIKELFWDDYLNMLSPTGVILILSVVLTLLLGLIIIVDRSDPSNLPLTSKSSVTEGRVLYTEMYSGTSFTSIKLDNGTVIKKRAILPVGTKVMIRYNDFKSEIIDVLEKEPKNAD